MLGNLTDSVSDFDIVKAFVQAVLDVFHLWVRRLPLPLNPGNGDNEIFDLLDSLLEFLVVYHPVLPSLVLSLDIILLPCQGHSLGDDTQDSGFRFPRRVMDQVVVPGLHSGPH